MLNKNHISWYDKNGDLLNKSDVAIVFGLLNNNIHKREYIRENYDEHTYLAEDSNFEKDMEKLSSIKQYNMVYAAMLKYVTDNKNSLSIETKLFDSANNYKASNIVFAERGGQAKAFILTYKDNDFNNEVDSIKELSEKEFCEICDRLYSRNHHILKTRTEERLVENLNLIKNMMTKTQEKISNTHRTR